MKQFVLSSLLLVTFLVSVACINEESITIDGRKVEVEAFDDFPNGWPHKQWSDRYEAELKEKDSLWKKNGRIEDYSDYGVLLIYLGRLEEARKVFIDIESSEPGRYSTAANLGTTYELLGKNDSALIWIKKSVAIDPKSHFGSEWLHIKILEIKLQKANLNSRFLLGTDFGNDTLPKNNMSRWDMEELNKVLFYQLGERMSFVNPPDSIVGLLLFELGNLKVLMTDLISAMKIYDMAIQYGYSSKVFETRYNELRRRLIDANLDNEYVTQLKSAKPFVASEVELKVEAASVVESSESSNLIYWMIALMSIAIAVFFILKKKTP